MPILPHLVNPNLSLPLFLAGLFLLYLDFNIPGKVLPAATGTLATCLALYGLIHTPIHTASLALLPLAIAAILLDLPHRTHNLLSTAGTILLAYALFHLADVPNAPHRVHPLTALCVSIAFTAVTLKLGRIALQARRNKAVRAR